MIDSLGPPSLANHFSVRASQPSSRCRLDGDRARDRHGSTRFGRFGAASGPTGRSHHHDIPSRVYVVDADSEPALFWSPTCSSQGNTRRRCLSAQVCGPLSARSPPIEKMTQTSSSIRRTHKFRVHRTTGTKDFLGYGISALSPTTFYIPSSLFSRACETPAGQFSVFRTRRTLARLLGSGSFLEQHLCHRSHIGIAMQGAHEDSVLYQ